jgi:hypothetical protein
LLLLYEQIAAFLKSKIIVHSNCDVSNEPKGQISREKTEPNFCASQFLEKGVNFGETVKKFRIFFFHRSSVQRIGLFVNVYSVGSSSRVEFKENIVITSFVISHFIKENFSRMCEK